jgi:hypothetical protein
MAGAVLCPDLDAAPAGDDLVPGACAGGGAPGVTLREDDDVFTVEDGDLLPPALIEAISAGAVDRSWWVPL